MIIGPKFKICRRLGSGVFDKCQSQKFMVSEARHSKGGRRGRRKQPSEYGLQLIEKQKIRFTYGLSEKQLSNYVKKAVVAKGIPASDKLFELLETRLDNVVYRTGLAHTRPLARQMVSHGHFLVNGKRTTVPSFTVKEGDVISLREGSKTSTLFTNAAAKLEKFKSPVWLSFDVKKMEAKITGRPKNEDTFLDFNTVLEFYSR
jgi:small subunit ribosomal protein S4